MSWLDPDSPISGRFSPKIEMLCTMTHLPGRRGVEAALGLLTFLPRPYLARAMARAWRDPPRNRMAWAALWSFAWYDSSARTFEAAGSRARLMRWLETADYSRPLLPFFHDICGNRDELPASMTVYRGGVGDPAQLALGLSWTLRPTEAAYYAMWRAGQGKREARPVIVRRTARREDVLWQWRLDGGELLIAAPGDWSACTDDRGRIEKLAQRAERRRPASLEAWRQMAVRCQTGDFWAGWTGDEERAAWAPVKAAGPSARQQN